MTCITFLPVWFQFFMATLAYLTISDEVRKLAAAEPMSKHSDLNDLAWLFIIKKLLSSPGDSKVELS